MLWDFGQYWQSFIIEDFMYGSERGGDGFLTDYEYDACCGNNALILHTYISVLVIHLLSKCSVELYQCKNYFVSFKVIGHYEILESSKFKGMHYIQFQR